MKPETKRESELDPHLAERRTMLRWVGACLLIAGFAFLVIGLVDIIQSLRVYGHEPRRFWFLLFGLPLFWLGVALVKSGFAPHYEPTGLVVQCPQCNTANEADGTTCKNCGKALQTP